MSGHHFKTRSDTESILHAYEEWGLKCLHELNGMFAFAIWDARRRCLFLAIDRMGIKPLYFVLTPQYFAFASEIKALLHAGLATREVNHQALREYLAVKYAPSINTLFQDVKRLASGQWLRIGLDGKVDEGLFGEYRQKVDHPSLSEEDYKTELRELVQQAVKDQMVADVPVGSFLSGGVDSGIVISEMSLLSGKAVKAFTIEYSTPKHLQNESNLARLTAASCNAEHTIVQCPEEIAIDLLPFLIYHHDEPISEPLLAPTYLLSRIARQNVTVVLTGEGADELFAGYPRYKISYYTHLLQALPQLLRRAAWRLAEKRFGETDLLTRILRCSLDSRALALWHDVFTQNELISLTGRGEDQRGIFDNCLIKNEHNSVLDRLLEVDTRFRLPEYILVRGDKLTMANSIEMLPPLLDNRIVDFAMRLPNRFKLFGRRDKYILREAFKGFIPAEVASRRKLAFSAPYEKWLPELTKKYLSDSHCAQAGLFLPDQFQRLLKNDAIYRGRHHEKIWTILVLEIWYRIFIDQTLFPEIKN